MTQIAVGLLVIWFLGTSVRDIALRRTSVADAWTWIVISLISAAFAAFPISLDSVSSALGFAIPANMIFTLGIAVLAIIGRRHSREISRLRNELQEVNQTIALKQAGIPTEENS